MSPRHRLTLLVTLTAVGIAIAWFILFRNHILSPPIATQTGPSLTDIDRQFTDSLDRLRTITERAAPAPASSDDARTPPAIEPVQRIP